MKLRQGSGKDWQGMVTKRPLKGQKIWTLAYSPWTRVICPTKFKNWRTLKSFWGIIYHICGVSLPPIPGHLELGGTQRIDILIKVILHCKMVQIGHFQRVIREVSRGCLMVPIFHTGQDMSIFRWSGEILKKNLTGFRVGVGPQRVDHIFYIMEFLKLFSLCS